MAAPGHAEPTPRTYWLIALFLGVITAIEVAVAYVDALDPVIAPILLTLSAIKFGAVVGWFMHLKFDRKLFRGFFLFGLIGAPLLFLVVLATFHALV